MYHYPNTIRLQEPWGGGHYLYDTGLCNRLLHWEIAYTLTKQNSFKYTILVQDRYWYELEFIELPCTAPIGAIEGKPNPNFEIKTAEYMYDFMRFRHLFDIQNNTVTPIAELTTEKLRSMYERVNWKSDETHLVTNFDWSATVDFTEKYHDTVSKPYNWGINLLRFKVDQVQDFIEDFTRDKIGIHIRRGNGVSKTTADIANASKLESNYFLGTKTSDEEYNLFTDSIYYYYDNDTVSKFIDRALQSDPARKFYISSDLPGSALVPLREKYNGHIYTKEDLISLLPDKFFLPYELGVDKKEIYLLDNLFLPTSKVPVNGQNFRRVAFLNCIDLVALSSCYTILRPPASSWSAIAERIKNRPSTNFEEALIEFEYNSFSGLYNTHLDEVKRKVDLI